MSPDSAELERTFLRNRRIFVAELFGKRLGERRTDVCWFCGEAFTEDEGAYHELCDTWKCPHCLKCFCDLPPLAQQVLDREMFSLGLWQPFANPKKRKKRSSNIIRGATKEDFLTFCEHYYKSWLDEYRAGRISFEELKLRVEADVGLVWVF
jgi:hypothetical protein